MFGYEDVIVFPLHITSFRYEKHVNLLLLNRGEKRHFCLIRNLSRLLGDRTKHDGKIYYCHYCLHGFRRQKLLESHLPYCSTKAPQRVLLPTEEKKLLKFENYAKGLKVPFVIYADFECFPQPCSEKSAQTEKYQKHVPSGFGYVVICADAKYSRQAVVYRGENVMDEFFNHLEMENRYIKDILLKRVPIRMTEEDEQSFISAIDCHIYEEPLGMDRV